MQITRIVSGLACMLFAAWFMAEWGKNSFPFEPLIGLLLSLPTWGWAEWKINKPTPSARTLLHPNDVILATKLRANFPPATRKFLRDHDFGQPYNDKLLRGVEEVAYEWKGAEFEYENKALNDLSSEIIRQSKLFSEKLATYSGIAENWPRGYYSIPTRKERGIDLFSDETSNHVHEINQLATELMQKLDQFEKTFRQLSPESYKTNNKIASV